MNDKDRLEKVQRKLDEHIKVCKICKVAVEQEKVSLCSIAHQLNQSIIQIEKEMKKTRFRTGRSW